MHSIRINKVINQMISLFYRIGFWHRGEKATTNEQGFKALYCIYHFLFTISLAVTAITTDESDESVFLAEYSIIAFVLSVKLCVLIWNQKRILELLNQICVFSIRYDDDFTFINKKLKIFGDFVVFASTAAWFTGFCEAIVAPFIGSERTLFFKIAFPWDWKNNDIAYCVAYLFMFSEVFLSLTTASINILIWYLMFNCSLLYQVLGSELTKMGQIDGKKDLKISKKAKQHLYVMELNVAIDAHRHITELVSGLQSSFSQLFLLQLGTSAACIGGTIYCLAFGVADNIVEICIYTATLLYNIGDTFSITYFGNEIMLSKDSLSYCLFESDWVEQPQSTKKCVIIFGEYLKQPQTITIGKLYPLTLETFKRILNSAYSMFNIMRKFKQ